MTYTGGTITSSTSATELVNAIAAAMVAEGWVFVEQVTISGNTEYFVYRNPASLNSAGREFYVSLYRATNGVGTVQIRVFEQWNTTTKLCKFYGLGGFSAISGVVPIQTPGPDQYAFNIAEVASNVPGAISLNTTGGGFTYQCSVTADRIVAATRVGTTDVAGYVGLYDAFHPSIDPFPLVIVMLSSIGAVGDYVNNSGGSATREPGQTVAFNNNLSAPITDENYTPLAATEGYSNKPHIARVPLNGRSNGFRRGLLKDVVRTGYAAVALVNGDTLTIGSDVYVRTSVASSSASNFFVPMGV